MASTRARVGLVENLRCGNLLNRYFLWHIPTRLNWKHVYTWKELERKEMFNVHRLLLVEMAWKYHVLFLRSFKANLRVFQTCVVKVWISFCRLVFFTHLLECFVLIMAPLFGCCLAHQRGVNQTLTQTQHTAKAENVKHTLCVCTSVPCTWAQQTGGSCKWFEVQPTSIIWTLLSLQWLEQLTNLATSVANLEFQPRYVDQYKIYDFSWANDKLIIWCNDQQQIYHLTRATDELIT